MNKKNLIHRGFRQLAGYIPKGFLPLGKSWRWLRFYPAIIPTDQILENWNISYWPQYQQWIQFHALTKFEDWARLHRQSCRWKHPPRISIVTPVHNTDPQVLLECILSVRAQAYPYWQLCLVDDASTNAEPLKLLSSGLCRDPRIRVFYHQSPLGISGASNIGIDHAEGDFVLFLDHDDRLSLDALYEIAVEIENSPRVDIVYSDRDMISPGGARDLHLFKPDWSPETLLSGNYVFHPMCYRRQFLNELGGLRSDYDGSQDYDLVLRAVEAEPIVSHIPKVLYHWRQHGQSVALDVNAKDYAFEAGIKALNAALKRRGIKGKASEIKDLWRGNYRVDLDQPTHSQILIIKPDLEDPVDAYASQINRTVESGGDQDYIAIISQHVTPLTDDAITGLAAWLQLDHVGLVSGKLINAEGRLDYIGMGYKPDGSLYLPYCGFPESEPGYMAVTRISRNISAPHPYCVVFSRKLWRQMGGFDTNFRGPYALLDFALRSLEAGWRSVVVPDHRFEVEQGDLLTFSSGQEKSVFFKHWQTWLTRGDPYININLDPDSSEMSTVISDKTG